MPVSTTSVSYDVVMATRNRVDAVALSLPLLLAQSRLPAQILVVDSSPDPDPIGTLVEEIGQTASIPVRYLRAEAGLTHQRNVGLAETTADVVIFPDDDSLLYTDAAERLMEIYEADAKGVIAGVAGQPVDHAPPETPGELSAYAAETRGPLGRRLQRWRQRVKDASGFANPFVSTGRKLSSQHARPAWLADRGGVVVPYMTGFRMSYRRHVIAPTGFDENLRRYGWFEDIDGSFTALAHGLVVAASNARIYHHRVAAARDKGYQMGLWAVLNRGYVVMKHVRANPRVFPRPRLEAARLRGYCTVRALAYRAMARDAFGRDRARGARAGLTVLGEVTAAPADRLAATYAALSAPEDAP